ncbi:MAG: hypothetical protein Q4G27_03555 [Flavobacteriaceae bacterium]|nr:hypothetical protein [Flavobacteriaceae bacterium]
MKILLISSYIFGYMDVAVAEMRRQGHEVTVFYYENPPLMIEYQNALHKAQSGMAKLLGQNLKKSARDKALNQHLNDQKFDFTLMIHGQYVSDSTHQFLKSISKKYVAYFFDSLAKMPEQKKIAPYFDTIFSYEPIDCETEGYRFITNFIPSTSYKSEYYKYLIFNIGGVDERFPDIQKFASFLYNNSLTFKFILYSKSEFPNFEQIHNKITVNEVLPLIQNCKIMLDFQRKMQNGLTFRVFEALGNDKKLITTNKDIVNYDFYTPDNIFILDPNHFHIPQQFLESPYKPIAQSIVNEFNVENWVKKILYSA